MTPLLRAEFGRFRSRDVVRMFVVAVLLGIAIAGALVALNSRSPGPARLEAERLEFEGAVRDCLDGRWGSPPPDVTIEAFCADQVRPEYFATEDKRFRLADLPEILKGASFLVVIGGLLLGASFMGAEWHHGTMGTLLTWEPRRLRVIAAKAIAAAVGVALLMLMLVTVFAGMLTLVAATRGVTANLGDHWLRSVAGAIVRIAAASSAAGLVGFSFASITRSTTAAVGIGFGYFAVVEGLIRGLRPGWQKLLFGDNVAVFISGANGGIFPRPRSLAAAAATMVGYAVVLLVLAAVAFRARDVN